MTAVKSCDKRSGAQGSVRGVPPLRVRSVLVDVRTHTRWEGDVVEVGNRQSASVDILMGFLDVACAKKLTAETHS